MTTLIRRSSPVRFRRAPFSTEPFGLMRELFNHPLLELQPVASSDAPSFSPRAEVKDTQDAYVFKIDLPGIEESAVDISLTGEALTVSGSREAEERKESETYYAYERSYGSFSRSFSLPEHVDVDGASASMKNGVLTVSVPKKAAAKARKLSLSPAAEKVGEA